MSDSDELFLITGATGNTGARTVRLLRESGLRVRASCTPLMIARTGYVNWAPKSCKAICWTFPRSARRQPG